MIEGGWEFVWSAYAVVWIILGGYALSLWRRHRKILERESSLR